MAVQKTGSAGGSGSGQPPITAETVKKSLMDSIAQQAVQRAISNIRKGAEKMANAFKGET